MNQNGVVVALCYLAIVPGTARCRPVSAGFLFVLYLFLLPLFLLLLGADRFLLAFYLFFLSFFAFFEKF